MKATDRLVITQVIFIPGHFARAIRLELRLVVTRYHVLHHVVGNGKPVQVM